MRRACEESDPSPVLDDKRRIPTMATIHPFPPDDDIEVRITDVVATTMSLIDAIKSARPVAPKKKQLRQAFAELAELKARRTLSVIHKLDCEIGLGDLS